MPLKLEVTIESSWRGSILDTVEKIAEFELIENEHTSGLFGLESKREQPITLTNREKAFVWAAKTAYNNYIFSLSHNEKRLLHVDSDSNFYIEAYLPDGKLYQFKLTGKC